MNNRTKIIADVPGVVGGRKVVVTYINPPIPDRRRDYQAQFDDDEPNGDGQMEVGRGATAQDAVRDLIDNYAGAEG